MKLTQWFGKSKKPSIPGVYQISAGFLEDGEEAYQYWSGRTWGYWGYDVDDAYECRSIKSRYQNVKWRGLAEDPSKEQA